MIIFATEAAIVTVDAVRTDATTIDLQNAIALTLGALVFLGLTAVLTSWVVSANSADDFRTILFAFSRKTWGAELSRVAVGLLILWCISTPRALVVVPPLLYVLHRQHTAEQALRTAKRAWEHMSARSRGTTILDETKVIEQALRDALTLWRPDAVTLAIRDPSGQPVIWSLTEGGQPTRDTEGRPRGHRDTDNVIERPLVGDGGDLGTMELIFRRTTSLTAEEIAALDVFASATASAITNARLHEAEKASARAKAELARQAEAAASEARILAEAMRQQAIENERLAREHELIATHDELTGVANRRMLMHELEEAFRHIRDEGPFTGLLIVNLRGFKRVNAILGHAAGDQLLRDVASRLSDVVRSGDLVARLGADEFAILLGQFNRPEGANAASTAIIRALRQSFDLAGLQVAFDVSAGLAVAPRDADTPAELLRRAQVALQVARRSGAHAGAVQNYDADNDPTGVEQLTLLKDLDFALRAGHLILHYQPKFDLVTGRAIGAEALVRWQHPNRGLLGPAEFMPAAEHTGLIGLITSYVLDVALAEAAGWHRQGILLPVSINISARDLHDPSLPDTIDMLLHLHNVAPNRLVLELTETAILSRLDAAVGLLARLRELGVRLSCDDFGTGNNSLARLQELPLSELKIDKSFVNGVVSDQGKQAIVRAIVDLGRAFNLDVVAEGIENAEEQAALIALGCTSGQGYHLSRPVPGPLIADVLKRNLERTFRPDTH